MFNFKKSENKILTNKKWTLKVPNFQFPSN